MSRIEPIAREDLPEDALPLLDMAEGMMGFLPNDVLVLARNPALLKSLGTLVSAVYGQGTLDPGFKRLIAYITSTASGCVYCQAHTAHGAHHEGIERAKIDAAWEYETSDLFTEAERAALRVAQGAGVTPNAVTDAEFNDLKNYYSEGEIVEIVGVISMFGFLNRWNATMATELEQVPADFMKDGKK
jgi:uncharacterized peroxidase-related enzyme